MPVFSTSLSVGVVVRDCMTNSVKLLNISVPHHVEVITSKYVEVDGDIQSTRHTQVSGQCRSVAVSQCRSVAVSPCRYVTLL